MHERQGWPQSIRWRSCLAVVRAFHAMESAVGIPSSHRVGSPFTVGKRCLDESVAGDCRWGHLFCARGGSGRRCDTKKKKMRLELFGLASNKSLERTADRREDLLSMTSALKTEAQLALVSGRSAWSR